MKKLFFYLSVTLLLFNCTTPNPTPPPTIPSFTTSTVTDIDGNIYNTVIICGMEWMTENLKTTHYRNGVVIPEVKLNYLWDDEIEAWCYYNNDSTNNTIYGKIYNDAVLSNPLICPTGWRRAKKDDWQELITCLNTDVEHLGGLLKSINYWQTPNIGATDVIGFNVVPGGRRSQTGAFQNFGAFVGFTAFNDNRDQIWFYSNQEKIVFTNDNNAGEGVYCRCIKD